jgi:TPP-dependent pyruvate/acetoin dehydrogenase alpha subunit
MAYGDATPTEPGIPWEEFESSEYLYRMQDLIDEWFASFDPFPGMEEYADEHGYVDDAAMRAYELRVGKHIEELEALQNLRRQDVERRIVETARRMADYFSRGAS